jgi:hypothetical protein
MKCVHFVHMDRMHIQQTLLIALLMSLPKMQEASNAIQNVIKTANLLSTSWMESYNVTEFRHYFLTANHDDGSTFQNNSYFRRVKESETLYSDRSFFHNPVPIKVDSSKLDDDKYGLNHSSATHIRPWSFEVAQVIPKGNRERNKASQSSFKYFGLRERLDDKLRILFIKTFKASSTTISSIFARLSMMRGWREFDLHKFEMWLLQNSNDSKSDELKMSIADNSLNPPTLSDCLLAHNLIRHSVTTATGQTEVKFHGGYQVI